MKQNTYIEVRSYSSLQKFQNRINHNNRLKNHSQYEYANDEFINVVEIVNKDLYKQHNSKDLNNDDVKEKQKIYDKIKSYKKRLKTYQNDLREIEKALVFNPNDFKLTKNLQKKLKSIKNIEKNILLLQSDYDSFEDFRKAKPTTTFNEIVLEITNVSKFYKRDKEYGKLILQLGKDFIEQLNFNMDIHSYSVHQDQNGMPHLHILGSYENGKSMNKDLANRYNKPFNFYELNVEFNKFAKEHKITKKFNLEIDDITKGGKKDYLGLLRYKEVQKQAKEQSKDFILAFREKFPNKKEYLKKLENKFYEILVEKKMNQNIAKKLEKELETIKDKFYDLKDDKLAINDLEKNQLKSDVANLEFEINEHKLKIKDYELKEYNLTKTIEKDLESKYGAKIESLKQSNAKLSNELSAANDDIEIYDEYLKDKELSKDIQDWYKNKDNIQFSDFER